MDQLVRWMTQAPPRVDAARASIFVVSAFVLLCLVALNVYGKYLGAAGQAFQLLYALYLLAIGVGSLLPDDRGGLSLRYLSRWLLIPFFAAFALVLVAFARIGETQTAVGIVIGTLAFVALSWIIQRYRQRQRGVSQRTSNR